MRAQIAYMVLAPAIPFGAAIGLRYLFATFFQNSAAWFEGIVPCGILEYGVTNLNDHLPAPVIPRELAGRLIAPLRAMLEN